MSGTIAKFLGYDVPAFFAYRARAKALFPEETLQETLSAWAVDESEEEKKAWEAVAEALEWWFKAEGVR